MRSIRAVILAACGLVFLAGSAAAQGGDDKHKDKGDDRNQEMTCKKAARIISKGHVEQEERWAYAFIVGCPGGAASLASAWTSWPSDAEELHALAARSREVADRRIVDAMLVAVRNTQRSQGDRRIAINVLLAQYDPTVTAGNPTWEDPEHTWISGVFHQYQVPGEQPVTAADRQRILEAFQEMSVSDPDPLVRRVAKRIFAALPR